MNKLNIKIEYEEIPIRHCSVQCPKCKKWFWDYDCIENKLEYESDLNNITFICPMCNKIIYNNDNIETNIEESSYNDMKKDCLIKKEIWE